MEMVSIVSVNFCYHYYRRRKWNLPETNLPDQNRFCFFCLFVSSQKIFQKRKHNEVWDFCFFFMEEKETIILFFGYFEEIKTKEVVFSLLKRNETLPLSNTIKKLKQTATKKDFMKKKTCKERRWRNLFWRERNRLFFYVVGTLEKPL